MSGFTPGPWEVASNGHYPVIRKNFLEDHHMDVCGAVHGYMYAADQKANQAANARLIAAAPEMYAAIERLLWLVEVEHKIDGGHIAEDARAALAKAT